MDTNLLKYATDHGIIDIPQVMQEIEVSIRKEILDKHPYTIWQGDRGYFFTYLPNGKSRVRVKRKNLSDLEDVIVKFWKDNDDNPTIAEIFAMWSNWKLTNNKIEKSTYDRIIVLFNKHFLYFGKKKIKNVIEKEYVDFLEKEITRCNLTSKSFANLKSLVRGMLKFAKKKNYISFNVDAMLSEIDVSDKEFKMIVHEDKAEVFDEEELSILTNYLTENLDAKNQAILLMRITGMRVGEVTALSPTDITDDYIFVHRTETRSIDDGKVNYIIRDFPKTEAGVRFVVIPKDYIWLTKLIRKGSDEDKYAFMMKGCRITGAAVRDRLIRICNKLEIFRKTPHKLRKTYVSMLLDSGVDTRTIIDQVGHTDINISENYYHRNRKTIEKKQDILSKVSELTM